MIQKSLIVSKITPLFLKQTISSFEKKKNFDYLLTNQEEENVYLFSQYKLVSAIQRLVDQIVLKKETFFKEVILTLKFPR